MIRVMEGHELFGRLQLRRIDWRQEMFMEEEELEREREQGVLGQITGKASSSGQTMDVDNEGKGAVAAAAAVDATKVTEEKESEKEGEEKPSWADVGADETL